MSAVCPECEAAVTLDAETVVGEVVACADCGAELEVTSRNPATLVLAPPEEEDWGE
ncbi:MAG: lysine biosynthesis protein LysW [Candidatus Dormibacteria bacterium]